MTQPNAWGVAPAPKAWADEVEAEEEKHGQVLAPLKKDDDDAFPTLGTAVKVKESKKEKKKKQTMSLTEFMKAGTSSRPSDDDILMSLPTKPRERAPGEGPPERGLGGGFGRDYGGRGGGGYGRRGDDDERGPRREREEDLGPSRAEMSDNWGRDRKFEPSGDSDRGRGFGGSGSFRDRDFGDRDRDRGGFGGDRERRGLDDGPSRADTEDRWGANRQFVPSEDRAPRDRSFSDRERDRGGFGDRDRGYGPPRDSFREPSRADTEDRWERKGDFQPTAFEDRAPRGERFDDRPRSRGFGETWSGARDGSRDAPRSFRDREESAPREASEDRWGRGDNAAAPPAAAGSEGPRERPKLNLAPRSVSADKPEAGAAPAAAKPNPFGAARPREEVLKEQGRDYRKEELQLEHKAAEVLREETEEEKALAREVELLRTKVEAGEADAALDPSEGAEGKTVQQALGEAEEKLARLQLELDDRVRYSRRQAGGEGRDGPRREEERGGSSWSRGPPREYSRERGEPGRRLDSRDRRPDDREERRGFEDRDRRDYAGRSYRDAPARDSSRDAAPTRGGSRW